MPPIGAISTFAYRIGRARLPPKPETIALLRRGPQAVAAGAQIVLVYCRRRSGKAQNPELHAVVDGGHATEFAVAAAT